MHLLTFLNHATPQNPNDRKHLKTPAGVSLVFADAVAVGATCR